MHGMAERVTVGLQGVRWDGLGWGVGGQREYISACGAPGKLFSYLPPVPPISPHFLSPCWGPIVV